MEAAIPMVKKSISDLVKSAPKIPTWVLTSIKDPDVKLVKKTADVEELKREVDALDHKGDPRDDPKEQILEGKGRHPNEKTFKPVVCRVPQHGTKLRSIS